MTNELRTTHNTVPPPTLRFLLVVYRHSVVFFSAYICIMLHSEVRQMYCALSDDIGIK